MKKLLAVALIILLGVFMFTAPTVMAQGEPCQGNFDYDQDVDGEDVTTFLEHFGRGQYSNPCPPSAPAMLPKTWQTTCYDETGTPRDCAGTGEDGEYQRGITWPDPRFNDKGDGTVVDNLTGLIWLKDANCIATNYPEFDNDVFAGDGMVKWQNALDFVNSVNSGTYSDCGAGYTDWVLPNIRELRSLVDFGQINPALPTNHQFVNLSTIEHYWSSTTNTNNPDVALGMNMEVGGGHRAKSDVSYLLPVRSGYTTPIVPAVLPKTGQTTLYATGDDGDLEKGLAWPNPRFTDNGDGTVTDNLTNLVWLKDANCFGTRTWNNALSDSNGTQSGLCGLTDGSNAGDWRLPNVNELFNLIDRQQNDPALPSGHPFDNVQNSYYWSSTTRFVNTDDAWYVGMGRGPVYHFNKTGINHVWPVRGGH